MLYSPFQIIECQVGRLISTVALRTGFGWRRRIDHRSRATPTLRGSKARIQAVSLRFGCGKIRDRAITPSGGWHQKIMAGKLAARVRISVDRIKALKA